MSQAQTKLKPPPLPEDGLSAVVDERVEDRVLFYQELHSEDHDTSLEVPHDASPDGPEDRPEDPVAPTELSEPAELALSELAPRLTPALRAPEVQAVYHPVGSNVFQLETVRHNRVWHQNEPTYHVPVEARRGRPRNPRRVTRTTKKRYRTGHAIVTLFALMGWLMVVTGIAAALVFFLSPAVPNQVGASNLLGGAAGVLIVGLLIVAMALTGRARFDQANATQEILAMQRVRAGLAPY